MKRTSIWVCACALLLGFSSAAQAALIIGGNTRSTSTVGSATVDGSLSFAVFSNDGGPIGDVFGTGLAGFDGFFMAGTSSGGFDTSASYLYLYQIVNDGPNSVSLSQVSVDLNGHLATNLTSWGYFTGTSFDDGTEVGVGNPLGNDGPILTSPSPPDTSGALSPPIVASAVGAVSAPSMVTVAGSGPIRFFFADALMQGTLLAGQKSLLVGFTSNLPWGFAGAGIHDGITTNGTVTSLVPAPSSAVMLFSMLPIALCGGFFYGRRMLADVAA